MKQNQHGQTEDDGQERVAEMLAPVRYSLPLMLEEVELDRESVRESGKLLNQDQIAAVFATRLDK